MAARVRRVTDELKNTKLVAPCDVSRDEDIDTFFTRVQETVGNIDFFVHSVAYAPAEDLKGPTLNCSRAGFHLSMDISAYSFIATLNRAAKIMNDSSSAITMTYLGGERVIPGYNLMGVCKAALEASVRYLSFDLGQRSIRVNGLSAGPVRTLAAAGIGDFKKMLDMYDRGAPLRRNITADEVASSAVYLLSNLSSGVTGEVHHVDCGYHSTAGYEAQ